MAREKRKVFDALQTHILPILVANEDEWRAHEKRKVFDAL
jgi:hypothetical protein